MAALESELKSLDVAKLDADTGRCDDAEADSRRMIALEPTSHRAPKYLANILASKGLADAARVALTRSAELDEVAQASTFANAFINTWNGDFEQALRDFDKTEQPVQPPPSWQEHRYKTRFHLLLEMGQTNAALRFGNERSSKSVGSIGIEDADDYLEPWCRLYRMGGIPSSDWERRVREWRGRRGRQTGTHGWAEFETWVESEACRARTGDEARAIIAANPSEMRVDRLMTNCDAEGAEELGRLFLLGGNRARALPFLQMAAHTCRSLQFPFAQMHPSHPAESSRHDTEAKNLVDLGVGCGQHRLPSGWPWAH